MEQISLQSLQEPVVNQSYQLDNCATVLDWVNNGILSPIKSFVAISDQEDNGYFRKQFSYKRENVEGRLNKKKNYWNRKSRKEQCHTKKAVKKNV